MGEEFGTPRIRSFRRDQRQENKEKKAPLNSPSTSFFNLTMK